ncbi:IS3 family transposase [Thiorhodospira sibirica]|uniref:IS3 family transposase n=1 Tax=Thiorhodospira sibirica TaxID=154347 RepID=UPI001FE8693E|nr:IS3 family transposase [Thiorhodospira sibirica]
MSEKKKRNTYNAEVKAKVGREAIHGVKTVNEMGQAYGVHPVQVSKWKKAIVEQAGTRFEGKRGPKPAAEQDSPDRLYSEMGRLKMELDGDWLKKNRDHPAMSRQGWIEAEGARSIVRQCERAEVARATVYAHRHPSQENATALLLCRLLDEIYTRRPLYGNRRIVAERRAQGHEVNRKCVQRLMRRMGLAAIAPGPHTRSPHPQHKVYPYRLRGIQVIRPNQACSTDITYVRLARGFCDRVAIIDGYSRKVLSERLSNTIDASFCLDCLEEALRLNRPPEVFNSDQGAQKTAEPFTSVLKREGMTISIDGRGRAFHNIFVERLWRTVKHEDTDLKGDADLREVTLGLLEDFSFYNEERPHQAQADETPATVYRTRQGGGALIVDKYGPGR